jgi:hypothetical protein
MGNVGNIGRGNGRGSGDGTRIGRAPTAEGIRGGQAPEGARGAEGAAGLEGHGTEGHGTEGGLGDAGMAQGRTSERPALRTGERPALRTGERPTLGTGERPALARDGSRTTTGSRPALPAAQFSDGLAQDRGGRVATAPENLVLPKMEVPEPSLMTRGGKTREMAALRDGKASTGPEASLEAHEGHTLSHMDTPIRGGGTRIVRMPEAPGAKGNAEDAHGSLHEAAETSPGRGEGRELRRGRGAEPRPAARSPEKDGFRSTPAPTTGNRPALGDAGVRAPVLPVKELIPPSLGKLADMAAVAKRFGNDLALLNLRVRPSELPPSDRALRAWAFFTAYAEAAAAHPATPEGKQTFEKALKDQGFAELRDARTGDDGVKAGQWVLESSNPEEARERAEQVKLEPPPEVVVSESVKQAEEQRKPEQQRKPEEQPKPKASQETKDSALALVAERPALEQVEGHPELLRVNPQVADAPRPVILPVTPEQRRSELVQEAALRTLGTLKKLGNNMLWNFLHRFRGEAEDSAIEKDKWDQLTFGAVLMLVAMVLVGIVLISL